MTNWASRSISEAVQHLLSIASEDLIENLHNIGEIAEDHPDFAFWHPETEAILDDLALAETLEGISYQVNRIRCVFALQHVAVAAVRESRVIFGRRMLTTFSSEWLQEHADGRYRLSDPLFSEPAPDRSVFLHEFASQCPVFEDFLRRARRAGIGPSGIISWFEVSEGTTIAVMLTSSAPVEDFQRRNEQIECDLAGIAKALAGAFARASELQPIPEELTDGELTVLREIAIGVSPHPSPEAIRLCRRMSAKTLVQAAIAVAPTGMLSYAPLRSEDFWVVEAPGPDHSDFKADHVGKPYRTQPLRRGDAAGVFGARHARNGWAVCRDGEPISTAIAAEREAEWICKQAGS